MSDGDTLLGQGMNPVDFPREFDKILLAGVWSPGKVTLNNHERAGKWDIKEGDGEDGGTSTFKGRKIAQFTGTFELVLDPVQGIDEFAEWAEFIPILERGLDGKDALLVYHPDLAELEIDCVTVEKIGGKKHDGKGGATVTVAFIGYAPAKPKTGTPKPKGSQWVQGKSGNDPNAAAKAELDALLNEAKKP